MVPKTITKMETTTTTLSAIDILEDMVKFYTGAPNRRATLVRKDGSTTCRYITDDGRKCAVGRVMMDEHLAEANNYNGVLDVEHLMCPNGMIDDLLKEEYRGHPTHFWDGLQYLHDMPHFWKKRPDGTEELSPDGVRFYREFKDKITESEY